MDVSRKCLDTDGWIRLSETGEILNDFEAESSKTKTLGAGVRIFNGAVRTEREFPLKILFLSCIQGFVVLLILRNGDQNLLSRSPNTISVYSVSKYFRTFFNHMPQINSNVTFALIDLILLFLPGSPDMTRGFSVWPYYV